MAYIFFYSSAIITWVLFTAVSRKRHLDGRSLIIGFATIAFSVIFDTVFGEIFGLYHYISPGESLSYIVLAAVLIYPFLNIIYTLFLPQGTGRVLFYTAIWIAAMLLFEYSSVKAGTIVFTGWNPIPWSLVTYVAVYSFVYFLYANASKRLGNMKGI